MSTTLVPVEAPIEVDRRTPPNTLPVRHRRRQRRPKPSAPPELWRTVTGVSGLSLLLIAVWAVTYVLVITRVQHARSQHELYANYRAEVAQALAPTGGVIAPGTAVAVISIPKAGLRNEVVVEGTTSGDLQAGPGHLRNTPLPGQAGVSVIFGRSVAFGGSFRDIPSLAAGDHISVTTGQGVFDYSVTDVRHPGDLIPAPLTTGSRLILTTSQGTGWRAGWSPGGVVYVDATMNGKTQPAPSGRPTFTDADEKVNATEADPITLMQVVLWLQLLVAAACVCAWVRSKWGWTQVWLVATPVLLAALWGLSNAAVRMLPNLM